MNLAVDQSGWSPGQDIMQIVRQLKGFFMMTTGPLAGCQESAVDRSFPLLQLLWPYLDWVGTARRENDANTAELGGCTKGKVACRRRRAWKKGKE